MRAARIRSRGRARPPRRLRREDQRPGREQAQRERDARPVPTGDRQPEPDRTEAERRRGRPEREQTQPSGRVDLRIRVGVGHVGGRSRTHLGLLHHSPRTTTAPAAGCCDRLDTLRETSDIGHLFGRAKFAARGRSATAPRLFDGRRRSVKCIPMYSSEATPSPPEDADLAVDDATDTTSGPGPELTISEATVAFRAGRRLIRTKLYAGDFPNAAKDADGCWHIPEADLLAAGLRRGARTRPRPPIRPRWSRHRKWSTRPPPKKP